MLSGLLITIDIFVCIALVVVVLLQRSEGGAFGMGGGPAGLVTARGAGDLLTRTTWILFGIFIGLSLGLSLLGAHDRASSSLLEKLKLQRANPSALSQPLVPTPPAPSALQAPPPTSLQPPPSAAVVSPSPAPAAPVKAPRAHAARHAAARPPVSLETLQPSANAAPPPPALVAPPPKSDDAAPASPAPAGPAPAPQP